MNLERGSVTIWGVGLIGVLFGFAGLAVDTWRVFTERQALAGLADSAAVAGANGVDEELFRVTGEVVLDQAEAAGLATDYLAGRAGDATVAIGFRDTGIEVTLSDTVDLTLLTFFLGGEPVDLQVTTYANPAPRTTHHARSPRPAGVSRAPPSTTGRFRSDTRSGLVLDFGRYLERLWLAQPPLAGVGFAALGRSDSAAAASRVVRKFPALLGALVAVARKPCR